VNTAPRGEGSDNVTNFPPLSEAPPLPDDLLDLADQLKDVSRLGIGSRAKLRGLAMLRNSPARLAWLFRKAPVWVWYAFRDLMVGLARVLIVGYSWLHMADERRAIHQMENKDARARAKTAVNKDNRLRLIVASIVGLLVLVGHLVLYFSAYWQFLALEALGFIALLEWIGHRPTEKDDPVRRRGPLDHGTSSRSLRKDLEEGFAAKKMSDVGVIGLTVNKFGWHGVFETELAIDDKTIEHLERWVHAPIGSLLVTTDPKNAAAHPFKLLIEDPLATPSVPEKNPGSRDIRRLANIGRHLFGLPLLVNLRQHIGLIGRSGSGKSSGLWVLIDWITSCSNAEIDGIDLTGGPAFPVWRKALRRRGTTPAEARSILEEALALATYRNSELARIAETEDDADLDENWDPQPGLDHNGKPRSARYIAIDEFHVVADDDELLALVKLGIRIGRKACVYFILATPGASKEDMGSVIIKAMVGLKILFSCIQQDVTNFLGGKMIELGWRPDKLAPASGGSPRDAGKAYVWDGDHQEPEVVRISRLSANDCRDRAKAHGSVSMVKAEAPDAPEILRLVLAAFDHYEKPGLPTKWILQFLTERDYETDAAGLAAQLKSHGVTTGRAAPRDKAWVGSPKGYHREDIMAAIEGRST
jgi:hypothetical protein